MGVTPIQSDQRYRTLVTDIGKAKIALATLTGEKVNIIEAAVGDGGGAYYSPTAAQTALVREVWRGEIANKRINDESPNMMDVKVLLPSDVGGWTIREVGLFDADGDLICITNTPDTEKALITTGATASLDIILHILFTDIESVTVTVNPTIDTVTADEVQQMIDDSIQGLSSTIVRSVTIPVNGWETEPGGGYSIEIPVDGCADSMVPLLTISRGSLSAAGACGMSPTIETVTGAIKLYAEQVPAEEIQASLALLTSGSGGGGGGGGSYILPIATSNRLGGVKIGNGINVASDGTISVDHETVMTDEDLVDEDATEEDLRRILTGLENDPEEPGEPDNIEDGNQD